MKQKVNLVSAITLVFMALAFIFASCAPVSSGASPSSGGGASANSGSSNKSAVSITLPKVGSAAIRALSNSEVAQMQKETVKFRVIFVNLGTTVTRETTGGTVSASFAVGSEVKVTVECLNASNQVIVRSVEKSIKVGSGANSLSFKLSEDGTVVPVPSPTPDPDPNPNPDPKPEPEPDDGDNDDDDSGDGDTPAPNPPAPVEYVNITFKQGFILQSGQSGMEWRPFTDAYLPQDGDKQKGTAVDRPESPAKYAFKGWIEGDQAPQTAAFPSSYVTTYTRDMTLSAIWDLSAEITFDPGNTGFDNKTDYPAWNGGPAYVEKGTSFTLPDYGEYWPDPDDGSIAKKHTGWTYGNGMSALPGGSVTITDNVMFTLTAENLVQILFMDNTGCFANGDQNVEWKSDDYVAKGGTCELPSYDIASADTSAAKHIGWERRDEYDSPITPSYTKGQSVTITEDMIDQNDWAVGFYITAEEAVFLQIGSVVIGSIILPDDGSIYERNDSPDGAPYSSLYFIWQNKPFTLPTAKKDDGSDVVTWELTGNDPYAGTLSKPAGAVVTYDEWFNIGSSGLSISPQ